MSSHSGHAITAPNYTQIPNVIFDYWMGILSPAEFKVLLCICRKTFGWQKSSDQISLKQMAGATNLHKSGVIKNVEVLIAHGLVNKIKSKTTDGDDAPNRYEINVHCVASELNTPPVVNSIHQGGNYCVSGGGLLATPPVVYSVDRGGVYSVDTQKKDHTKERHTKEGEREATSANAEVPTPRAPVSASLPSSKEKPPAKETHGEFGNCQLSEDEHQKLIVKFGEKVTRDLIVKLDRYIASTGKKYKSHYATILNWKQKDDDESRDNPKKGVVAPHREKSKLAFETKKDTWRPTYANEEDHKG